MCSIMKKMNYLAGASAAFVLATTMSTAALAWHPQGTITKEVQNVTLGSSYADANDAATAITARPGDVLRYRMTVLNPAPAADKQWNDLTKIKVTDALPAGVTIDSGTKDKDFGSVVVVPQATKGNKTKSVSYEFTVKVNDSAADKSVICNTATFTGNSITGDAPRSGSDKACVKVTVPPTPQKMQVCDLVTKQIITINVDDFDKTKHSDKLDACREVPAPPTMVDVCDLATKQVISIDQKQFDITKHSYDLSKCKETPEPKSIEVCERATKKIVTITEDQFDANAYSDNLDDCGQILSTTIDTPKGAAPAVLPDTGTRSSVAVLMATAVSSLAYGVVRIMRRHQS